MFVFCFNDCISNNHSDEIADRCLENSLREYNNLALQFPGETDGIITSYTPSSVLVNQNSSLNDCISRMSDHELKRYAYSVFIKFPYEPHYIINDVEDLIKGNYHTTIDKTKHNAVNLIVVFRNQGILFSLAVHDDICKNQIPIFANEDKIADVDNLFGHRINTEYIAKIIRQSIYNKADNLGKLLMTVGNNKVSDRFLKNFEHFPTNVQQAVVFHFADAKKRNLPTPFSADNDLIKDVTPEKETKIKIFELRIFNPIACRVYFYETTDCIYLGSVENKPNKKTQNSHINTARSIIKELVAL